MQLGLLLMALMASRTTGFLGLRRAVVSPRRAQVIASTSTGTGTGAGTGTTSTSPPRLGVGRNPNEVLAQTQTLVNEALRIAREVGTRGAHM